MGQLGRHDEAHSKGAHIRDKDHDLLERIRKDKDMDAFEELMTKYQDKVWRLARGITRYDADAEDVLQDVFLTVFRKLDTFEGRSSFSSWLYRIAANASYMKLRTKKGSQAYAPEEIAPLLEKNEQDRGFSWALGPEEAQGSKEAVEVINGAIEKLPEEYRTVLVLRDVEEFNNREVGDMLGLTTAAVKSRLHRARLFLRKELESFFEATVKGNERN